MSHPSPGPDGPSTGGTPPNGGEPGYLLPTGSIQGGPYPPVPSEGVPHPPYRPTQDDPARPVGAPGSQFGVVPPVPVSGQPTAVWPQATPVPAPPGAPMSAPPGAPLPGPPGAQVPGPLAPPMSVPPMSAPPMASIPAPSGAALPYPAPVGPGRSGNQRVLVLALVAALLFVLGGVMTGLFAAKSGELTRTERRLNGQVADRDTRIAADAREIEQLKRDLQAANDRLKSVEQDLTGTKNDRDEQERQKKVIAECLDLFTKALSATSQSAFTKAIKAAEKPCDEADSYL